MKNYFYLLLFSTTMLIGINAQTVTTLAGPNCKINDALVMDNEGNIYGSQFGQSSTGGSSIYRLNTDGSIELFSTGYSACNGLDFDIDGHLYVVDFTSQASKHQIYKLDSVGNKTPYGPNITGASGIIFDPLSDTLYVSQYSGATGNKISKLSPDGNVITHSDHSLLNGPVGMAFDDDNQLYVANFSDGEIYKITNNGDSLHLVANIPNSSFWGVGFITYASGYLYATGIGRHKIYKISLTGDVTEFAGTGAAGHEDGPADMAKFNRPNGITTNHEQDKIYISDLITETVREISNLSTGIHEITTSKESSFEVYQNYPNPTKNITSINYELKKNSHVSLQLISLDGRILKQLISKNQLKGSHNYELNTQPLAIGNYLCRLSCNGVSKSIKISVIK